jgi:hypothetical protein
VVPVEPPFRSLTVACSIVVVGVVDVLPVVRQSCSFILSVEEACGNWPKVDGVEWTVVRPSDF